MIIIRMYICICNAITQRQVEECAQSGAASVEDLASQLGVGAGCGRCRECAAELLAEICGLASPVPRPAS
jgi:bacterioferritin-associated ferredoxin